MAVPALGPAQAGFACRLCGNGDLHLLYTLGNARQFRYYRCANCGLVNYDLAGGVDQGQYTRVFVDPRDDHSPRNRDNDQSFGFLARYAPVPGRLLDIGCGNGRLLWVARQKGWDAQGLELSPDMARYAAGRVGCPVRALDFLQMEPGPEDRESFDVVSLRHVLEHLPWPRKAMDRINALLKPGGLLLVEVPNIEGLSKRWVRFSVRTGLHRRRFPADFAAGHCCEYSRRSLEALLNMSGFDLVRYETYSKKPLANWFLSRVPVGTKARALARRRPGIQGPFSSAAG